MAANVNHTDVICLEGSLQSTIPSCPHGPTLLFERYNKASSTVRKFFACSAFRDRKACQFFKWADSVKESSNWSERKDTCFRETHGNQRKRYFGFKKLSLSDRHICRTCGLLLLSGELPKHESQSHDIKKNVKLKELRHPSYLFIPLEDNKTFAQYLFSKKTIGFIVDALSTKYSHLLCIGTPRIHEFIQSLRKERESGMNSFLLDLDQRYGQFYSPQQFCQYNMFNNHFFEKEGPSHLMNFLRSSKGNVVFLVDPPFGGMVEPLAHSLSKLSDLSCPNEDSVDSLTSDIKPCDTPFLLFFPYFMEKRIIASMGSVTMLDYKVEYDNHDLYKNGVKKKGSPVRIFIHKSLSSLQLPAEDGYWWCKECQRYSAAENWHCKECGACTSKDGSTYIHCELCHRCVKPSRKHCMACNMCQVQDHICGNVKSEGCFICGELDHKRRDCPQKGKQMNKRPVKRKAENRQGHSKKKRF